MKVSRLLGVILWIANLGVIFWIWTRGSLEGALAGNTVGGWLIALGALAGLLAFYLVLCQMLLIGRVGWIERAWGHDRLSHIHHLCGLGAIALIGIHPILLTIGYSSEAQVTLISQFFFFLTNYHDVLNAFIAYVMFLAIVSITLTIIRKRLRYETWYVVHICLYVAIILAFNHQFANGHDLVELWIVWYWKILFYGTFITVAYYRFVKPILGIWWHGFQVERLGPITHDVTSVIITGKRLERLHAKAGQFVIVRFLAKGFWWEAHPFSLSEMPDGKRLRLSIKAVGDFTKKIPNLPAGTKVFLEGPLGRFTADRAPQKRIALIAGGIGITPLRSLFEQFMKEGRAVDLIYAARSEKDFALKNELDVLSAGKNNVHYIPDDSKGRLTPEIIKSAIPDIAHRDVFLCGPPPMMKAIRGYLATLGVPKKSVMYEKFQLG